MHRRRVRPLVNLVVLVAVEVGALVFLRRLGGGAMRIDWSHLGSWLATTSPVDAVAAVARALALAGAYWLGATTALYVLGRAARAPALVRGIGWVTVPGVRTLVDAALAVSITGASVFGGAATAHAAPSPPPTTPRVLIQLGNEPTAPPVPVQFGDGHVYVPVPAGDPTATSTGPRAKRVHTPAAPQTATTSTSEAPTTTTTDLTARTRPSDAPLVAATGEAARAAPAGTQRAAAPPEGTWMVTLGDNLWTIAAHHLADVRARPLVRLGAGEIARYWLKVVEANRGKLASGNPSLIHPGERVVLPAVDG